MEFQTAFAALIDADEEPQLTAAIANLLAIDPTYDGMRLALYDAFGDGQRSHLDRVARLALSSPRRAASMLLLA